MHSHIARAPLEAAEVVDEVEVEVEDATVESVEPGRNAAAAEAAEEAGKGSSVVPGYCAEMGKARNSLREQEVAEEMTGKTDEVAGEGQIRKKNTGHVVEVETGPASSKGAAGVA